MTGRRDLRGCPDGFIFTGEACVDQAEGLKSKHLCAPTDFTDCVAQCEAGSQGSCGRLGRIIGGQPGRPGGAVEAWRAFDTTANQSAVAAWLPALKSACEQGEGGACYAGSIAILRRERSGGPAATGDEMAWFNERGCEAGEPNSCYALVPRTSKRRHSGWTRGRMSGPSGRGGTAADHRLPDAVSRRPISPPLRTRAFTNASPIELGLGDSWRALACSGPS